MSLRNSTDARYEPGLDAYRGLVVVMLVVVHARRLQSAREAGALDDALALFMWLEPFIAASFLFIAGFSLVLSHERAREGWLGKLLKRALGLYVVAVVLFVPQFGLELPDLLASPGILSAIALAIALVGALLSTPRPASGLAGLALAVLAVTFVLDRTGATVSGLNAGPGGAFPLVAFTAAGALLAHGRRRYGSRALAAAALGALPLCVGVLLSGATWVTTRSSYYASHAGQLALTDLGGSAAKEPMVFWNHSALGALGLLLPLVVTLAASLLARDRVAKLAAAQPLVVLGRHALAAYVAHLGLLGVTDLAGLGPASALGTWTLVAGISAALLALSFVLDRVRPRAARAPAVTEA